jgi:hypothetical protein
MSHACPLTFVRTYSRTHLPTHQAHTKRTLGSRECSASVLKMEVGALPAIIARHSELSSHSITGQTMPSRA